MENNLFKHNIPTESIFKAIHECVMGSLLKYILDVPKSTLIQYICNYPLLPNTDVLYYLMLKKYKSQVYYDISGKHILLLKPELSTVYIHSHSNLDIPSDISNPSSKSLISCIKNSCDRTYLCPIYRNRINVITCKASKEAALSFPSIALNFDIYTKNFNDIKTLIKYDHLKFIGNLLIKLCSNDIYFSYILDRINFIKVCYPNFWNLFLKNLYLKSFNELNILNYLYTLNISTILRFSSCFPEFLPLPSNFNFIHLRIWFHPPITRAFLLGYDISLGVPSEEMLFDSINDLSTIGIDKYLNYITMISFDSSNLLTGHIGLCHYPNLTGKKLYNMFSLSNEHISTLYLQDIFFIVIKETAYFISYNDINNKINSNDFKLEFFINLITPVNFPFLPSIPNKGDIYTIFNKFVNPDNIYRGHLAKDILLKILYIDNFQ